MIATASPPKSSSKKRSPLVAEGAASRYCDPTAARPASPIYGKGIYAPWAVSVDGNDNIWVSNLSTASDGIVELRGFRTENCPPGMKTGDSISPPEGYVGGGRSCRWT